DQKKRFGTRQLGFRDRALEQLPFGDELIAQRSGDQTGLARWSPVLSFGEDDDIGDGRFGYFTAVVPENDVVAGLAALELRVVARTGGRLVKDEWITVVDRARCKLYDPWRSSLLGERHAQCPGAPFSFDRPSDPPASLLVRGAHFLEGGQN